MDFDDQEADEHEEPEPISVSSEPANFINHLDTKSVHPNAAAPFDPHAPPHRRPRFKECLKNHAVGIGGHTVDGCGEFMPAGEDGTLESLRCAACGCHRNFHRKEINPPGGPYGAHLHGPPPHQHLLLTHHPHSQGHFGYRNPSGYLVAAHHQQRAPAPLALPMSSGGGDDAGDEIYYSTPGGSSTGSGKKRYRTKFTQDQKDKMLQLALRLDWKIQKEDDETVQRFCEEVGIKRRVLKVWMHNNKQTLGKKT